MLLAHVPTAAATSLPSWLIDVSLALAALVVGVAALCAAVDVRTWAEMGSVLWRGAKIGVIGFFAGLLLGSVLWPDSGQSGLMGAFVTGPLTFALSVVVLLTRPRAPSAPQP